LTQEQTVVVITDLFKSLSKHNSPTTDHLVHLLLAQPPSVRALVGEGVVGQETVRGWVHVVGEGVKAFNQRYVVLAVH
jgi:hypothetical protein